MHHAALVFHYGNPMPGREAAALQNFADAQVFFGKLAANGTCGEPEFLGHGFGGGMIIIRAESPVVLFEVLDMEEAKRLINVAEFTSTHFRYEFMWTGERIVEGMANYAAVGTELGYL